MLLTIVRPQRGSVRVLGGDPEDPRIRARVGYLPERLELPAHFTPVTFLASVSRLKHVPPLRDGILRLLDRVGLANDDGRKIGDRRDLCLTRCCLACIRGRQPRKRTTVRGG